MLQVECDRPLVTIDSGKVIGNGTGVLFPCLLLAWHLPVTGVVLWQSDVSGCFMLEVAIASYTAIWILYLDHLCPIVCKNLGTVWRLEGHQLGPCQCISNYRHKLTASTRDKSKILIPARAPSACLS